MAIQTLTCKECGHVWTRAAIVGRPPLYCDNCSGKGFTPPVAPAQEVPEGPSVHKAFNKLMTVCGARVPAMLVGPAGSGKTTAGRQVAEKLELPFYAESCNPQMTKWDLMGFVGPNGNYVHGILTDAFRNGGVVLLDEMDASNPALLVAINNVAACSVGETVNFPDGTAPEKHADFILIAGCNTFGDGASDQYVGREQLDAATLDRFAAIEWDYDEALERKLAGPEMREWVGFVQAVRQVVADLDLDLLVSPRATINGGALLRAGLDKVTVAEMTVFKGAAKDTVKTIQQELRKRERQPSPPSPPFTNNKIELTPADRITVQRLILENQKITAIKHVRSVTAAGLREAKDFVDAEARGLLDAPSFAS